MHSNSAQQAPAIVWFRDDLRICDNPALYHAAKSQRPIIAIYIFDEKTAGTRPYGSAQKWFLHHAIENLSKQLSQIGICLHLFRGEAAPIIQQIVTSAKAGSIFWSRRYDKTGIKIDTQLKSSLKEQSIEVNSYLSNLLLEPFQTKTKTGGPYKVYTPFWRALEANGEPRSPYKAPKSLQGFKNSLGDSVCLEDLRLVPKQPNWATGWEKIWSPSETGAVNVLHNFIATGLTGYKDGRDSLAKNHFSSLSPYLRFGLISPYQIWHSVRSEEQASQLNSNDCEKFLKQLAWREFSYHLLFHFPDLCWKNFNPKFDHFPWRNDASLQLRKWQEGQTGYPVVDAAMRELWQTGFMHNRTRMIVGSFLVKHLMIDWREGEKWFWDTLVDGDPANNAASWQWIAGCGADAAPYFRIFNPILQGTKFDGQGEYTRKFVPEIANLPNKYLHAPWEAPKQVLKDSGVTLGETYPYPIVDHRLARTKALAAFKKLKKIEE